MVKVHCLSLCELYCHKLKNIDGKKRKTQCTLVTSACPFDAVDIGEVDSNPSHVFVLHLKSILMLQNVDQPTLGGVSAVVEPGKLLAVIGPIGAGKVRF